MFQILFICTGNWFRSRFAEIYFNHQMKINNISTFTAISRGLDIQRVIDEKCPSYNNEGYLSTYTGNYLAELGISYDEYKRQPLQLTGNDLMDSQIIICMDKREHKPMIEKNWRDYKNIVHYWNISDLPKKPGQKGYSDNLVGSTPDVILPNIKQMIDVIIDDLKKSIAC